MKGLKTFLSAIYVVLIILILLTLLNRCNQEREFNSTDPDTSSVEQAQEIGNSGALKITLLWDFMADIDLHVIEPSGEEIFFNNSSSSESDGFLDVDNTTGSGNPAAENIYWENPPAGTYTVKLHYYAKKTLFAKKGKCTVVIIREGHDPQTYKVRMKHVGQEELITTFTL